jgi:hypothetical protein
MERRQIDLGLADILEQARRTETGRAPRSRTQSKKDMRQRNAGRRPKQRPGKRERQKRRR